MNNLIEILDFNKMFLEHEQVTYFIHYLTTHYYDHLQVDQGTEVILKVLKDFGTHGAWLDVGAGPTTMFWGLVLEGIHTLHCTEMHVEALYVLDSFIRSQVVPQCYRDVMNMYNIAPQHLAVVRKIPRKYFLFDALRPWPSELGHNKYDLITAFGIFGLSNTPDQYRRCFKYLKPFLNNNGVAIGANWVRSQYYIHWNGGDNRYVDTSLVESAASMYGYSIRYLTKERIHGDKEYDAVIIWALQK